MKVTCPLCGQNLSGSEWQVMAHRDAHANADRSRETLTVGAFEDKLGCPFCRDPNEPPSPVLGASWRIHRERHTVDKLEPKDMWPCPACPITALSEHALGMHYATAHPLPPGVIPADKVEPDVVAITQATMNAIRDDTETRQVTWDIVPCWKREPYDYEPPYSFEDTFEGLFREAFDLLVERQKKYGPENIRKLGLWGVFDRLASDKIERVRRAFRGSLENGKLETWFSDDFGDESLEDALYDIANYALIMLALKRGVWGRPLREEME